MKHLVSFFAVFFAAGAMTQSLAQSPSFKDPNLEATVHKFTPPGKEKGPLSGEDLAGIVLVSAEGVRIHDLAGLDACKKLTFLYLPDAPVTDLTPISKLSNLEAVTIHGGKIQDLTPLAGLTNLQYLDLSGNQISDLKPLAGLKNLHDLNLSDNKVSDLGPLPSLPALEQLHLANNQVSDLGPLAGMKSPWLLDIKGNRVTDLSPLAGLNWRYLYLDQNRISDLAPLIATMPQTGPTALAEVPFRTLSLSGNPLSAEARARELPELQKRVLPLELRAASPATPYHFLMTIRSPSGRIWIWSTL
jgi:Leucine-rich repeat (LRR) protein